MKTVTTILLAWPLAVAPLVAQQRVTKRLSTTKVDPRDYRLGLGLSGEIPSRAFDVKVGGETVRLWDLDGDGQLKVDGGDGISLSGLPFIVQLPGVLLMPSGQFRLSFPSSGSIAMEREKLDLPAEWVKGAATMTRVRIAHGKRPLRLDEPASQECARHCNYLRLNPPSSVGWSWHEEQVGCEGFSAAGAAAGRESCIYGTDDIPRSIEWTASTVWHCEPIMDPDLTAFGLAGEHGWTLIRPLGGSRGIPFVHPADGAEDVSLNFAPGGEFPNPVPGTDHAQGCGHPVFAHLNPGEKPLVRAALVDEHGQDVAGTQSCPHAPAAPDWPTNSDCAVFVPTQPLRPGTRYRATFVFEDNKQLSWEFRTRAGEDQRLVPWLYTPMPEMTPFDPGVFLGEGKSQPMQPAVSPQPAVDSVLPSWVPKLHIGEIRVVQDPVGGWWYVESRLNDRGLLSLHAYGPGPEAKARAEEFADIVRRDRNRDIPPELRDRGKGQPEKRRP